MRRYLGLLCNEVPRSLARQAVLQASRTVTVIRCIFSHCILPSYCRLKISQSWQALAHFDEDNARACLEGFAVSMLALYGTGLAVAWCRLLQTLRHTTPMPGASEFEDQIVRFKPDGSSHFLVLAWDLQTGLSNSPWVSLGRNLLQKERSGKTQLAYQSERKGGIGSLALLPVSLLTALIVWIPAAGKTATCFSEKVHISSCTFASPATVAAMASQQH